MLFLPVTKQAPDANPTPESGGSTVNLLWYPGLLIQRPHL